jgi:hypothetical protein
MAFVCTSAPLTVKFGPSLDMVDRDPAPVIESI